MKSEEQPVKKEESYPTDTPLVDTFGEHAKTRMIATLLSKKGRDLNISDLARISGISRNAVYEYIDDLVELGIVEKTREVGNSQMYALDMDDEIVEKIDELEGLILKRELENEGHI